MKIIIAINTYKRCNKLLGLLRDIKKQGNDYNISIHIYEDFSNTKYQQCISFLDKNFPDKYKWFCTSEHCGRENYWQIIDTIYKNLKYEKFDYFIHLPDDIRLEDEFFSQALIQFESITDKKKACLNLLNDYTRVNSIWTHIKPSIKKFNGTEIIRTGWIDMIYISDRIMLKALNYTIYSVNNEWFKNPEHSSGVGMQLSQRIFEKGFSVYQVKTSLVTHGFHDSVMHPEHREKVPLISNNMNIIASIASMPSREESLKFVINSIINQVNELWIYLNDYNYVPDYLKHEKIKIFRSQEEIGDIGDAGKFYKCDEIKGYHFTIDDDLIYPPDYVLTLLKYIEQNKRKYAITCHGRVFDKLPVHSYYKGATRSANCLHGQLKDMFVHVGGTGVMAYYTGTLKLSISDFEASNMADIWFARACNGQNVPILAIKHKNGWIKESKYDRNYTIYSFCNNSDQLQTKVINSMKLTHYPVL